MKKTLRQKLEEIDAECADCPPELAEAALGVIRIKLAEAMKDVATMEVCAELINPNSNLWGSVRIK